LAFTTDFFVVGFAFLTGFSKLLGLSLLVGPSLRFALSLALSLLLRELLPDFSAKRTFAIMMVLSSAAVFGGFFEDEALAGLAFFAGVLDLTGGRDLAAGLDFLAAAFLTGFFRGLVLYGFLAACLELRGLWFKLRIAVELSGRNGMGRNTHAGFLWDTSRAA
jgi:hypothetical protein